MVRMGWSRRPAALHCHSSRAQCRPPTHCTDRLRAEPVSDWDICLLGTLRWPGKPGNRKSVFAAETSRMKVTPYGAWESPITSDLIVTGSIRLGDLTIDNGDIYWVETRPNES